MASDKIPIREWGNYLNVPHLRQVYGIMAWIKEEVISQSSGYSTKQGWGQFNSGIGIAA